MLGEPFPNVIWYKDNVKIEQKDNRYNVVNKGSNCSMVISNVTVDDSGKYVCQATNVMGYTSTYSRLKIMSEMK